VLAQDFGFLIGGIVAVETVFAYPGLGRMWVEALQRQDLPLMQAAILVLTGGLLPGQSDGRLALRGGEPAHSLRRLD
jgi:ABC-type dipeptide/oligopeptide/nickel transport system permease component